MVVQIIKTWRSNSTTINRSTKSLNRELFGYDGVVSAAKTTPCVRIIKQPSLSGDAVLVFSSALLSPNN